MEGQARRVALALGAGGARGYAHIGAIQVVRERGYEIVSVAGSSMGAVVGGLFAAGKLDDYTAWVLRLRQVDVLRLLDPGLSGSGVLRADKMLAFVRDLLGGALIEELPVAFTAVATDLLARKAVWFQEGPVDVAIRASIAIPSIITPVVWNGRLLVDGGVLDPVPIAAAASARADATIAISLSGERRGIAEGTPVRETAVGRPVEEWVDRLRQAASQWLDNETVRGLTERVRAGTEGLRRRTRSAAEADAAIEPALPALGPLEVMNLSLEATQALVTRYRLAGYPPDVLISVPKDACRTAEFHRAREMIELGRRLTTEALDAAGFDALSPPSSD